MALIPLLDVNIILGSRWTTHPNHFAVMNWITSLAEFYTSPITELAFIRVSLSPAYRANWKQAQEALHSLQLRPSYRFLPDDVNGTIPFETAYTHTTDAHLVALAQRHGLRLATLDRSLVEAPWALGLAYNPIA